MQKVSFWQLNPIPNNRRAYIKIEFLSKEKKNVYKKQMPKDFVTRTAKEHALRDAKGIILIGQAVLKKSANIHEIGAKLLVKKVGYDDHVEKFVNGINRRTYHTTLHIWILQYAVISNLCGKCGWYMQNSIRLHLVADGDSE